MSYKIFLFIQIIRPRWYLLEPTTEGGEMTIEPLTKMARTSLSHTRSLEGSKAVFIPKAGRTSYTSSKNFRLISLTSFLLKIVDRLFDTL